MLHNQIECAKLYIFISVEYCYCAVFVDFIAVFNFFFSDFTSQLESNKNCCSLELFYSVTQ